MIKFIFPQEGVGALLLKILLLMLAFIAFGGNKAYCSLMPMENPMPDKLLLPAELLNIDIPDKLPSGNHDVDMPKLPAFKSADKPPANRNRAQHLPELYEALIKEQPFIWPVIGRISSGYGFRFNGTRYGIHEGIDIPMPKGTPIMASRGGVVKRADSALRGYGRLVIIDHGNGIETRYAHCSEFAVKKGDIVNAGQIIAYVGNSGRTTSSHLHFEVAINGRAYDPMRFLGNEYQTVLTSLLTEVVNSY